MASALHTVVTLEHKSGLPEDRIINTFNFIGPSTAEADAAFALGAVQDFYCTKGDPGGVAEPMGYWLAESVDRAVLPLVETYDVSGLPPYGSPISVGNTAALPAPVSGMTPLPAECAVCLSYRSSYGDLPEEIGGTRPRARRRGRLYLGPLGINSLIETVPENYCRVSQQLMDAMIWAAKQLLQNPNVQWAVWSRVDHLLAAVVQYWIDNAFDTQRRRGEEPSARSQGALEARPALIRGYRQAVGPVELAFR